MNINAVEHSRDKLVDTDVITSREWKIPSLFSTLLKLISSKKKKKPNLKKLSFYRETIKCKMLCDVLENSVTAQGTVLHKYIV